VKILGLVFVVTLSICANEGKILFEKHCVSCHTPFISMSKLKENFLDYNNTLLKLKAPTLNQLSYRLKQQVGDRHGDEDLHRMEVTAFMSDYVIHPDKDKSVCLDDVIQHFKTMPSLKGKVSEKALESIGDYLYDFDTNIVKLKSVKYEGFEQALHEAKKEHKVIMLEVMSKECHFCRKMDREVLIEKEVLDALKKDFISVKIDISTTKLPLGLTTTLTPSFIFIDENSKVFLTMPGAWKKDDFLHILKEALVHTKEKK